MSYENIEQRENIYLITYNIIPIQQDLIYKLEFRNDNIIGYKIIFDKTILFRKIYIPNMNILNIEEIGYFNNQKLYLFKELTLIL